MAQAAKKSQINVSERFAQWTRGAAPGPSLTLDRDYYLGRMTESDVNGKTLEQIYAGLRAEVGNNAAKNFVLLVNGMEDFHTPLFIDAFVTFWQSGCKLTSLEQRSSDRDDPRFSSGGAAEAQFFAVFANAISGEKKNAVAVARHAERVKGRFIQNHQRELRG